MSINDFICLTNYDVTFSFLFTEYKMLTVQSRLKIVAEKRAWVRPWSFDER